jgi:hypothetical protein
MKYISYYIRNIIPDGRNKWCIMLLYDFQAWPERNRLHKGATMDNIRFRRNMTPEEINEYEKMYRLFFVRYYNWNELIEDEERILGKGHDFIEQVIKPAIKDFPNIPLNKPGQIELQF